MMLTFGKAACAENPPSFRILPPQGAPEALCTLLPPEIEQKDRSVLSLETAAQTARGASYISDLFSAEDAVWDEGGGLFRIVRTVKNLSGAAQTVKLILTVRAGFAHTHWLIPCVNYNGNEYGPGNYPKGFLRDGEPWVFAYDRTGIPSCSLGEDEKHVLAVFASDRDPLSLTTSASVTCNPDGTLNHRILYPVTEAPYSYTNTDTLTPRLDTWLSFEAGEEKRFESYLFLGVPPWKNYGFAALCDRLAALYRFDDRATVPPEEVWELGIRYAEQLIKDYKGRRLFASARRTDLGAPAFELPKDSFEIGWAGQNALSARLFILHYIKTGERRYLEDGMAVLDAWAEKQDESGLFLAHYEWYPDPGEGPWIPAQSDPGIIANFHIPGAVTRRGKGWYPETCNLGWGALEFAKSYALLKSIGIEKPEYLNFAVRTCDFFLAHFDETHGFGKSWRFDGTSFDATGSIGGFVIPALLEVYKCTRDKRYLDMAKRSLAFYVRRDVDAFACTAGAIDCACVDKETVYPFMVSALDLYDLTGEAQYLEWARKCGYYFFSWAYHYDCLYPETSDFSRYGYHTKGGTAVSAQHHAIDSWGSLLVPEFLRLWRHTGDERWHVRAYSMWCNATLCIARDENYVINGTPRPLGSQNEAFFQCRWTRYRPTPEERGHFNNWLISWVSAYRLNALDKLSSVLGESDWSLLS